MSGLLEEMSAKALKLNIPLNVQLDLTYRCNERCVHCYLDHDDHGEMTTAEIKHLLDEMADAGVFILTLSGGEIFLRKDFFEILEHARRLMFCVKLKTNAVLDSRARGSPHSRLRRRIDPDQHLLASRRKSTTRSRWCPARSSALLDAIRFLKSQGLKVIIANVLMTQNMQDYPGVRALAAELGVECTLDPTVTPMMDGNRSTVGLGINSTAPSAGLPRCLPRWAMSMNSAPSPPEPGDDALDATPCSAGHTACYVSPYGDVFPCVQFPLPTGNVRSSASSTSGVIRSR